MLRDNEKGAALVMVMIMLVVGSIFVAVMLRSVRTHMNTAVHEENMSQAFYSAESGVEYVRANKSNTIDKIKENNNEDEIYNSSDLSLSENMDKLDFSVYIEDKSEIKLKSVGKINDMEKEITFNLRYGDGYKSLNIKERGVDEHYNVDGGGDFSKYFFVSNNFSDDWDEFIKQSLGETRESFEGRANEYEEDEIPNNFNESAIVKGDLAGSGINVEGSILVIDGSLGGPGSSISIKDSVIVVKDWIDLRGISKPSIKLEESLIFVFGKSSGTGKMKEKYVNLSGAGNFDIIPRDLPEDFDLKIRVHNWQQK